MWENIITHPAEITLEYTYKIPTKEMYVDVPSFYEVERGYTEVFDSKQNDEKRSEIKGIVVAMMESVRNEF